MLVIYVCLSFYTDEGVHFFYIIFTRLNAEKFHSGSDRSVCKVTIPFVQVWTISYGTLNGVLYLYIFCFLSWLYFQLCNNSQCCYSFHGLRIILISLVYAGVCIDFLIILLCTVLYLKLNVLLMTTFLCTSMVHLLQWRAFILNIYGQIANQWV